MILPKLDQLINDLYVYWGKEMGSFLICYAGVVRASIRNEKTFVMWVNRLISYFEDIIADDVPLPPLHSTIMHMKELISWKTEEEFFDLLLQTYEDNIWHCIRGAGEAILSETSDNTDVAWTTGYDQFCYEIFKPLLSGTKERYADFKKNKTRVLKGLLFQVTPMMCSTSLIRRLTVFGMCSMHMQNYEKTKYFYRVSKIMNEIRLFRMCFRLGIQKRSAAT